MRITFSGEGEGSLAATLSTWFQSVAHPHEALLSLSILGFSSHLSCEHKFLSSETKIYPLQKCVYPWGLKIPPFTFNIKETWTHLYFHHLRFALRYT